MAHTLAQVVLDTIRNYPKPDFMLYKKEGRYEPLSTEEFGRNVRHLCLGLRELGLKRGDKVILLSENRPEWVIVDHANLCLGAITVPIYTSLVPEQIKYSKTIIRPQAAEAVLMDCFRMLDEWPAITRKIVTTDNIFRSLVDASDLAEERKRPEAETFGIRESGVGVWMAARRSSSFLRSSFICEYVPVKTIIFDSSGSTSQI